VYNEQRGGGTVDNSCSCQHELLDRRVQPKHTADKSDH